MSTKKYCQECGSSANKLTAKFCEDCGNPFGTNIRAAQQPEPVPAPEPRQHRQRPTARRRVVEEEVEADDDENEDVIDDAYVPDVNGLEVDIEVHDTRQKIGNLAGTSRVDFQRPPDKVPKNKKAFESDFMQEWQREAGTARRKK